jgi:hypothetical protein
MALRITLVEPMMIDRMTPRKAAAARRALGAGADAEPLAA